MCPDAVLIFGGDFNTPGINWSFVCLTESSYLHRESLSENFLLEQIVTEKRKYFTDLCFISHLSYVCQRRTVSSSRSRNFERKFPVFYQKSSVVKLLEKS